MNADRTGLVSYRFTVPAAVRSGQDVVTFVGSGTARRAKPDRGNLTVGVPRIATCRFVVASDG